MCLKMDGIPFVIFASAYAQTEISIFSFLQVQCRDLLNIHLFEKNYTCSFCEILLFCELITGRWTDMLGIVYRFRPIDKKRNVLPPGSG